MVWVYSGTPGSGKSLHCAQDILFKLKRGQRVICNFPINIECVPKKYRKLFFYVPDEELNPKFLFDFAKEHHKEKKEGQTLLFIDECQRIFPIDRTYTMKKEWEQFFQLHRHYGYNIILVTQMISYINKGIRIQAEYEVKHRKVNNYKIFGAILGLVSGGALFTSLEYWVGSRQCTNQTWFTYKKKYGKLYDTFSGFNTDYGDKSNEVIQNDKKDSDKTPNATFQENSIQNNVTDDFDFICNDDDDFDFQFI